MERKERESVRIGFFRVMILMMLCIAVIACDVINMVVHPASANNPLLIISMILSSVVVLTIILSVF